MKLPAGRRVSEPYEFAALAAFNAERARGLVHTPEWVVRMDAEQDRFDAKTSTKGGPA